MNSKFLAFSTFLVAAGATAPAAMLNGEILDRQCDDVLLTGCEGLPPPQYHIDQPEPSPPIHGLIHSYVLSSATVGPIHEGVASIGEAPDLASGRG
jgi:hypothetical protein